MLVEKDGSRLLEEKGVNASGEERIKTVGGERSEC